MTLTFHFLEKKKTPVVSLPILDNFCQFSRKKDSPSNKLRFSTVDVFIYEEDKNVENTCCNNATDDL